MINVVDLGCGEAKVAASFHSDRRVDVRSFDLIGDKSRGIEQANINVRVGVPSGKTRVVVLCLALMGSDCFGALREANRMMQTGRDRRVAMRLAYIVAFVSRKPGTTPVHNGILVIAEVVSRFDSRQHFVDQVSKFGFRQVHQEKDGFDELAVENSHFFTCSFTKVSECGKHSFTAKPCIYKKR